MRILDAFGKALDTVSKVNRTTDTVFNEGERAKRNLDKVSSVLEKKCKVCKKSLKSDLEKKKEMCADCALKQA